MAGDAHAGLPRTVAPMDLVARCPDAGDLPRPSVTWRGFGDLEWKPDSQGGPDPAPHALVDQLTLTLDGRDRHSPGRPEAGIGEKRPRDSQRCRHQSRGEDSVVAGLTR